MKGITHGCEWWTKLTLCLFSAAAKPDANDEKRIKILEKESLAHMKELESLKTKSSTIENQIKELQEKILEVGGVKLRALQSKVTNTRSLIEMAGDNMTKAEVAKAKAERDSTSLEKTVAENQVKSKELEAEMDIVASDCKACTTDLQTIKSKVEEAQNALEFAQETLTEAKAELEEKTGSINAFRALELEISQKLDEQTKTLKDHKLKYKHWEKRFQDLELVETE